MAYKALYRTYRPQTFEEVAGQKHIIQTLKNALANNKIAHAYLFCGPRGTGKTTMAKLFAKALNCEEGIGHQCNKCSNCVEVTEGSHPDVIEIDAASNNGVEQVRDLIDKVNYLPIKGRYKVYIIDEVHMMTTSAFNALLKTIEEPPAHVIFILATTEPHNILPTILSRCQRYDFSKVSDGDIEERMSIILEKEGIKYDQDAVRAIISLADGGMRDALSILDQILAYSGNTLSVDDVYSLFGLASEEEKVSFIKDVNSGDIANALGKIKAFSEGGVDLKRLTEDLLEILKDVLILKKTKDEKELTVISEAHAEELSSLINTRKLNEMIGALLRVQVDYKTASNIKTMFEVTILRLCTLDEPQEKEVVVQKVVKEEPKKIEPEPVKVAEQPKVEPVPVKEEPKPVELPKEEKKIEEAPSWLLDEEQTTLLDDGERYEIDDDTIVKFMVMGDKDLRKDLMSKWTQFDSFLSNPAVAELVAFIKDSAPFIVTKDVIVLEFTFDRQVKKANIKENAKAMADFFQKLLGKEVFVYSLSRADRVRTITAYHNLRQISKLPKPNEIEIDIKELAK